MKLSDDKNVVIDCFFSLSESMAIFKYKRVMCSHRGGHRYTCCLDFYRYCVAARTPLYREAQ